MTDDDRGGEELPEITLLFDAYLASREGGAALSRDELLARAGEGRETLERRIETYERLTALAGGREADDELPSLVGRFQILARVGHGGLGRVFLARDPELDRQVAVKVLDPSLTADREERAWVLNEARSLARLEHPGVVRVFEVGSTPVHDWVVMEYLPGPSLAEVIAELRRMPGNARSGEEPTDPADETRRTDTRRVAEKLSSFSERTRVLHRLARALAFCHDHGVLHRDIKPANVIFDEKDEPRLIDFGLAHLSDATEDSKLDITSRLVGTPAFIAPEQVESGQTGADPRSDQFSFAALAYEFYTLESAFRRSTRTTTLDAIALAAPRTPRRIDPTIPPDLERIVLHALERDPDDRYPAFTALAEDLTAVLENRPISITEAGATRLARLWYRRNRARVTAAMVVLVLLVVALVSQWGLSASTRRSAILNRLDAVHPAALTVPGDFEDRFDELGGLRDEAKRFDEGFWQVLVFGTVGDAWRESAEETSVRLGEVIAAELASAKEEGRGFQTAAWRALIVLESRLVPDFMHNAELRRRGLVELELPDDPNLEVWLLHQGFLGEPFMFMNFSWFRTIDRIERPIEGRYRYVVWDRTKPDSYLVVPFVVDEDWGEAQTLPLPSRRAEVLAETKPLPRAFVAIPPTPFRAPPGAILAPFLECDDPVVRAAWQIAWNVMSRAGKWRFDVPRVEVPAVRILSHPVTREEFRRFLESVGKSDSLMMRTEGDEKQGVEVNDSEPVWVSAQSALEYARWVGGRLPSATELAHAEALGAIELRLELEEWEPSGEFEQDLGARLQGEWTCELAAAKPPYFATFIKYHDWEDARVRGNLPTGRLGAISSRDSSVLSSIAHRNGQRIEVTAGLGFRVVFPADCPKILESLVIRDP